MEHSKTHLAAAALAGLSALGEVPGQATPEVGRGDSQTGFFSPELVKALMDQEFRHIGGPRSACPRKTKKGQRRAKISANSRRINRSK